MLSCVVKSRPHLPRASRDPRQSVPFLSLPSTFPNFEPFRFALSHSLDALPSKSVHQPFSHQPLPHSFLKVPGCMSFLPCDCAFRPSDVQTCGPSDDSASYPLSFHILAHSFARSKNSSLVFSIASALFAKNYPGWGYAPQLENKKEGSSGASPVPT